MKGQEGRQMASCRIYYTLSNCFWCAWQSPGSLWDCKIQWPCIRLRIQLMIDMQFWRSHLSLVYYLSELKRFSTIHTCAVVFTIVLFLTSPSPHLAILRFHYNITKFRIIKWQLSNAEWFSVTFQYSKVIKFYKRYKEFR